MVALRNQQPRHDVCAHRPKRVPLWRTHTMTAYKAREVSGEELELALQMNARPMLVDAFARKFSYSRFFK